MDKLIIGENVSFNKDKQLIGALEEALSYNSNTFMFYTGAPQNTARSAIDLENVKKAKTLLKDNNIDIDNVVVHAPYIINLANEKNHDFSINFLKQEIKRCEMLGIKRLVLHPGSHVGLGIEKGIENISIALNQVLDEDTNVYICLETMAGKGSEVGSKFEELKAIIDKVELKDKLKVCLDTCHMNDAGYDISDFDKVLSEFDKIIGLKYIYCVHINDSKNLINTHKDRHENIGYGTIGFDNLIKVIYHEKLKDVPKILETPYVSVDGGKDRTYPPYKFEIEEIRQKELNSNLIEDIRTYYK